MKHEVVAELKRLALELGRTPTRADWRANSRISLRQLTNAFGGFSVALTAAGFEPSPFDRKRPNPLVRDIATVLADFAAKTRGQRIVEPNAYAPTALAGDLHFPFAHADTLSAFFEFLDRKRPARVIQMGDLYDMFSQSKFPRTHNVYTPEAEMDVAYAQAKKFWKTVREILPDAACFQILGNHDIRPLKRLIETFPAGESFFSIERFFRFDGVETNFDYRQELCFDDVLYFHGYRTGLGAHRDFTLRNTCVAHTHVGGVAFRNYYDRVLWELNAGYMGDPESKALSYTAQRITTWTHGWGFIDEDGPRFVPA